MYNKLPFFDNTKINRNKNLHDQIVAQDLKKDLNQLIYKIQNLPFIIKSYLSFTRADIYIFNSNKNVENIIKNKDTLHNIDELKKNINNLGEILNKNKKFESYFKNFLGENYLSTFKIVSEIVNKS